MVMANNNLDNPAGMGIPALGVGCQAPVAQIRATGASAALGSQGAAGEEATGPSGNAEPLHSALPVVKSSHCACWFLCNLILKFLTSYCSVLSSVKFKKGYKMQLTQTDPLCNRNKN
jgi:hypothetical protein